MKIFNFLASTFSLAAFAFFIQPAQAENKPLPAGTYKLDKHHASLTFKVMHMGFSNYTADFDDFDATLEIDPAKPENAKVTATVNPGSLDLPSPPDGFTQEILGDKWLNAAKFPQITFTSTKVEMIDAKTARINGDLELMGVKKPIVLDAVFNGGHAGSAMESNARIGFSAKTSFNRSDFGFKQGIPPAGSNMGIGDKVSVEIEAEFKGPAQQK
jgi:polyisoprenoid-binding protein YceI